MEPPEYSTRRETKGRKKQDEHGETDRENFVSPIM